VFLSGATAVGSGQKYESTQIENPIHVKSREFNFERGKEGIVTGAQLELDRR
jgi:hypothetical protein